MNGPNKLTETYLPDKAARKEKIIVGLSGGMDSLVSAYLLKIQRYDLIGVTIVPGWEEIPGSSSALFSCSLSEKNLETISAFCHQLGIPHHVIRISSEFREAVVERWMARKAAGELPDQCWMCHELRMSFLHSKMKELGGKNLATGHFAKIYRNEADSITYVQSSNDETHDQSALLSRLPQDILKDLMLPLSDLQKKEVIKLAENFGVLSSEQKIAPFQCFPEQQNTIEYLAARIPPRFHKPGEMVSETDDRLPEHEGVIKFRRGSQLGETADHKPLFFAKYSTSDRKIILKNESWFLRTKIVLRHCVVPADSPWKIPFRAVLVKDGISSEGWFYPKTLNSCLVELDTPVSLLEGEILSVLKKKGKNSRIILTGTVCFIDEVLTKDGEPHVQIHYDRDF